MSNPSDGMRDEIDENVKNEIAKRGGDADDDDA